MKISHISKTFLDTKSAGLELLRHSKRLKIVQFVLHSSANVVMETTGIAVYMCNGSQNYINKESVQKFCDDVKNEFGVDVSTDILSTARLPLMGDWFIQLPEKNVVAISMNLFKPLEHIEGTQRKRYILWVVKNYLEKALKGFRVRNKKEMEEEATSKFLVEQLNKQYNECKSNIRSLQSRNDEYSQQIIENVRKMRDYQNSMIQAQIQTDDDKMRLMKEIRDTLTLPFVNSMKFDEHQGCLIVDVGRIEIDDVYIGDFDVYIFSKRIRFKNRTNKRDEFDHPHVDDGGPCFGNRDEKIRALMANMQLKSLVFFCYHFLKTYTEDDAMHDIGDWFLED